jgi:transposase
MVYPFGMRAIYARPPTDEERRALQAGLKSEHGITVRRSQIILMSADQQLKADRIGQQLGLSDQLVRNVVHAFNNQGVTSLQPGSRARHDDQRAFDDAARERLREIIRQSPRSYGFETSLWTLELLAAVSFQEGLTVEKVHFDTVSRTLMEMGIHWSRAKHGINSPDAHYERKKSAGTG